MADPEASLVVEGFRYGGWKSIRVTRSIESMCGSFSFVASDRWDGADDPWPIAEDSPARVEIDGQVLISGYVTDRDLSADAESRELSYTGADKAVDIVDSSLLIEDAAVKGHKWTYRNLDIAQFVRQIAAIHDIKVSVQAGLVLKKDPSLIAHPGETCFDAIKRGAGSSGVLVVSDGVGGIVITRTGTTRAAPLIEGVNIKHARATYSSRNRFHRYLVTSQPPGSDEESGEALRVQATATDVGVPRTNRVLVVRPEKGMDTATARRRADWESRVRAAKAASVTITVVGWRQPDGKLWPINALVQVKAPRSAGIEGEMLISQVEYSLSDAGQLTDLTIVRPDAFEPEPQTAITGGEGAWKELAKGAL